MSFAQQNTNHATSGQGGISTRSIRVQTQRHEHWVPYIFLSFLHIYPNRTSLTTRQNRMTKMPPISIFCTHNKWDYLCSLGGICGVTLSTFSKHNVKAQFISKMEKTEDTTFYAHFFFLQRLFALHFIAKY